jgi:hypothetical protein
MFVGSYALSRRGSLLPPELASWLRESAFCLRDMCQLLYIDTFDLLVTLQSTEL